MRVRIAYTVELQPERLPDLLNYARSVGLDHDDPAERVLLQRLFRWKGEESFQNAEEFGQFNRRGESC